MQHQNLRFQVEYCALERDITRIDEINETEHRVSVKFDATTARLPLFHHTGGHLSRDMGASGAIVPSRLRMDGSLFRYEH